MSTLLLWFYNWSKKIFLPRSRGIYLGMRNQTYIIAYGIYSPIGRALDCEANVLRSIHSSGELKRCIAKTANMFLPGVHYGLGRCLIHESQDLASVGQHDLRIKALNKGNLYLPSMRSVSYLSCRRTLCIHSKIYPNKSRYKHYASRSLNIKWSFIQIT